MNALREHRIRPTRHGLLALEPSWPMVEIADGAWAFVIADLADGVQPSDWRLERPTVVLPRQLPTEEVEKLIGDMPCALLAPRALMQLLHYAWTTAPANDGSRLAIVTAALERLPTGDLTNVAGLQKLLAELEETASLDVSGDDLTS